VTVAETREETSMTRLRREDSQRIEARIPCIVIPSESRLQLTFLGVLSLSFVAYFAVQSLDHPWMSLLFAHLAAVSIMGFYGCLAGVVARKKGYDHGMAFHIAFFLPMILGVISGFALGPAEGRQLPFTCGGWVALGCGLVVVLSYLAIRNRAIAKTF
jgi:hypothetical protein